MSAPGVPWWPCATGQALAALCAIVEQAAREVMAVYREADVGQQTKADHSLVTQADLRADALILLHRFILLIVDEAVSGASGCSIDKSVHVIQRIEQHYQMQLLNRLNLILLQVDELHTATFSEVKNKLHHWQDAYLFDNSITSLQQLHTRWLIPVKDSYLVR